MRKFFAFALAVAFIATALPTMAAERTVAFYGDVRMMTFSYDADRETAGATNNIGRRASNVLYDDRDTQWDLDAVATRLGVRVTDGDLAFNWEVRPRNEATGGTSQPVNVRMRHWYGTWNFGVGTLVIGQTWSPLFVAIGGCCADAGYSGGFGDPGGSGRIPQIALWFPIQAIAGNLKIAFETNEWAVTPTIGAAATETDRTLPKIEGLLDFALGPVKVYLGGGWQSFEVAVTATDREYDVDSHYIVGGLDFSMGPITIKGRIWQSQNLYQYTDFSHGAPGFGQGFNATYSAARDVIDDAEFTGYGANIVYKLSDMISFEVAYFALDTESDQPGVNEDDARYYYINAPITIAKNVWITPEIGKADLKDRIVNGVRDDEGDVTYWGAYWRIAF